MIGFASVGGGIILGLTGGLAAPLIGSGLATVLGSSAIIGAIGTLGGSAIVGSLFGVAGASLTGNNIESYKAAFSLGWGSYKTLGFS